MSIRIAPALLAAALACAGCVDSALRPAGFDADNARRDATVRHAHLFYTPTTASGKTAAGGGTAKIVLQMQDSLNPDSVTVEANKLLRRYKLLRRFEYSNVFYGLAAELDEARLQQVLDSMAADPDVKYVEPDVFLAVGTGPPTPGSGAGQLMPWGMQRIGAHESITASGDGTGEVTGVDIYILDSGIRRTDLNVGEVDRYVDAERMRDDLGHGSHVAGIAAGRDNDRWFVGVAPGAPVYGMKVLDDQGETDISNVIAALEHIIGVKHANPNQPIVVNMSFGADVGTTENTALDDAVEMAINNGIVVVASAGNDGIDASNVTPAHAAGVITVGAYDVLNQFAPFSNYGPAVDILAPGVTILSTGLAAGRPARVALDGTSMAAPHVTGAVALFLSQNPLATPAQVLQAITDSGRPTVRLAPPGTTDKTIFIGEQGLLDEQVPPFFHYAVFAGSDLVMERDAVTINSNGGIGSNGSVMTNGTLRFAVNGSDVDGFGYYGTDITPEASLARQVFRPNYNPASLESALSVKPIDLPPFAASDHLSKATITGPGGMSMVVGLNVLGTESTPEIVYVDGDYATSGEAMFMGHGVLLVTGQVKINHPVSSENGDASSLAIYSTDDMHVYPGQTIRAQLLSGGNIYVYAGASVTGSLTARGRVEFMGQATVTYQPANPNLTAPIWASGPALPK